MIGDPSGKSVRTQPLLTTGTARAFTSSALKPQLARFLDFDVKSNPRGSSTTTTGRAGVRCSISCATSASTSP
jgi:hypothetical protein